MWGSRSDTGLTYWPKWRTTGLKLVSMMLFTSNQVAAIALQKAIITKVAGILFLSVMMLTSVASRFISGQCFVWRFCYCCFDCSVQLRTVSSAWCNLILAMHKIIVTNQRIKSNLKFKSCFSFFLFNLETLCLLFVLLGRLSTKHLFFKCSYFFLLLLFLHLSSVGIPQKKTTSFLVWIKFNQSFY